MSFSPDSRAASRSSHSQSSWRSSSGATESPKAFPQSTDIIIMRSITKTSVQAFLNNRPFKAANMRVVIENTGPEHLRFAYLLLHGNTIARKVIATGAVDITTAGWNTRTTLERLNGLPGVHARIRSGCLELNGKFWSGEWTAVSVQEVI